MPTAVGPSKSPTTTPAVVTMPVTAAAVPVPWIAGIRVTPSYGCSQTSNAVNPTAKSAVMLSGGSFPSTSVTWAAKTVTVQTSPSTKSASGLSVNVVGPPLTTAVCVPLSVQVMSDHEPVTLTGS